MSILSKGSTIVAVATLAVVFSGCTQQLAGP